MATIRLTNHPTANDQLLYFTSTSILPDGQIVIISDQTGHPNLFVVDSASCDRRQLTDNRDGYLHSYVYFDGKKYIGLGKASISLHAESGTAYFIQGRDICAVDMAGNLRTLAQYPDGQVTAFTHVSADGKRLCVPTTDAQALEGYVGQYDIDQRVREEGLSSYIRVYDTTSGQELISEQVPNAWVTHVQFHPNDNNLILYNHEWSSDCGIRRMWLFDSTDHRRIRPEGEGRSRSDWTCHEMWEHSGAGVIYHGVLANQTPYIGRFDYATGVNTEIPLPDAFRQYGHFTVAANGLMVSDGYYREDDDDDAWGGKWISVQRVDWGSKHIEWIPICRHGSNWDSQDSHPHPIFSADSRSIFFTSNPTGKREVYRVPAPGA